MSLNIDERRQKDMCIKSSLMKLLVVALGQCSFCYSGKGYEYQIDRLCIILMHLTSHTAGHDIKKNTHQIGLNVMLCCANLFQYHHGGM